MAELVLIPQSDALPERVITAWGARLAPADMNRLNTFTHPRRRREFVIARTLLRTLSLPCWYKHHHLIFSYVHQAPPMAPTWATGLKIQWEFSQDIYLLMAYNILHKNNIYIYTALFKL